MKSFDIIGPVKDTYSSSDKSTTPSAATTTTTTTSSTINSLPNIDATAQNNSNIEREIKIINAVEHLKAMGYKDKDGWLTRLAVTKKW
jgi:hypothetical protein